MRIEIQLKLDHPPIKQKDAKMISPGEVRCKRSEQSVQLQPYRINPNIEDCFVSSVFISVKRRHISQNCTEMNEIKRSLYKNET